MNKINFVEEDKSTKRPHVSTEDQEEKPEWTEVDAANVKPPADTVVINNKKVVTSPPPQVSARKDKLNESRKMVAQEIKQSLKGEAKSSKFNKFAQIFGFLKKKEKVNEKEEISAYQEEIQTKGTNKKEDVLERKNGGEQKEKREEKKEKQEKKSLFKSDSEQDHPNILKTNLIEGESTVFIEWENRISLLISNILLVLIVLGISYGVLIYKEINVHQQQEQLTSNIEEIKQKIVRIEKEIEEGEALQKKIDIVNYLLSKHIYWTNFFAFIEDNTLADVYYADGIEAKGLESFSFNARAKNFKTITDQIKVFRQNKFVKDIRVETMSLVEEDNINEIEFTLDLEIDKELFYYKSK